MRKPNRILWEVNGKIVASFTDFGNKTVDKNFMIMLKPERIIFNDPATIVFWSDGSKTVVKCSEDDTFDTYTGFTMAYLKKIMGSGKKAEKFIGDNEFEPETTKWISQLIKAGI